MPKLVLRSLWIFCLFWPTYAMSVPVARYDWVRYSGTDPAAAVHPVRAGTYRNPILPGFQPDPSIVRVGRDYYLVNSSFGFFPGIPVFQSRDLITWQQIGNAIDRPSQLNMSGIGSQRGIFAPAINFHDGLFYIVNTCIDCGGNFIITAKNPAGPWSDPVWLPEIDGIDPSLFVAEDGRAWIVNNGPPDGAPLYEGHRAIWIQAFDLAAQKLTGPRKIIVNGGVDLEKKPIWVEGPHIFRHSNWYYLIAAEGGTSSEHSETVYRSKNVDGPYLPGPENPILTQRDLDPARALPITASGHADFVALPDGRWWSVFLANRPYAGYLTNMGRETFLLPVSWQDGWPRILPKATAVPYVVQSPYPRSKNKTSWSGWKDDFASAVLDRQWLMLRSPTEKWFHLNGKSGTLMLDARPVSMSDRINPSFLGVRQRHSAMQLETEMRFTPEKTGDRAGLVAFADEAHHYFIGLEQRPGGPQLVVRQRAQSTAPAEGALLASTPYAGSPGGPIYLKISAKGPLYDFSYRLPGQPWKSLMSKADGRILATEYDGLLFTGTVIGPYAGRSRPD